MNSKKSFKDFDSLIAVIRDKFWLGLTVVGILACLIVIGIGMGKKGPEKPSAGIPEIPVEKESFHAYVQVSHEITSKVIEENLREMGMLITQEYDFTEVGSYSDVKKIWGFIKSESSFLYSYDGTVTAGINFGLVKVNKDEEARVITIHLPASEIFEVTTDPNSFINYEEKTGFKNPISISDFNDARKDLENNAKEHAIAKGILKKADEHAKNLVTNFVKGLVDPDYTISVVR